jgi:hypothetical protein
MNDVDPPDPQRSRARESARETDSDPFGEVLPVLSSDEEADAWGESADDDDRRLRDEVPPHHG